MSTKDRPLDHLPASMLAMMAACRDRNEASILLTRHSIREPMDGKGLSTYELPLTDAGRRLAHDWGNVLNSRFGFEISSCLSSPIPRCVETAALMLVGHKGIAFEALEHNPKVKTALDSPPNFPDSILNSQGERLEKRANGTLTKTPAVYVPPECVGRDIEKSGLLVEPGSFVVNVKEAGPFFLKYGALEFMNHFFQGELKGMKHPRQGALDILELLFKNRPLHSGHLLLAVTHDTILAALMGILRERSRIEESDWPEMMEGMILSFDGNVFEHAILSWYWRDEVHQKKIRDLFLDTELD